MIPSYRLSRGPVRWLVPGLAFALFGCGSWGRAGSGPAPQPGEALAQVLDLNAAFRRIGRLTGGAPTPFVADVALLAGPGDSTIAVIGVSLENQNLSFQRDGDVFVARYHIMLSAQPVDGGAPVVLNRDQSVRVATFPETQRSEESVLFQEGLTLSPGAWKIAVQIGDPAPGRNSRAEAQYTVPRFGPGSFSAPALAYQVRARSARNAPISVILNSRGTIAYGGDSAIAFVEAYALPGPRVVPIRLAVGRDSTVMEDSLRFVGGREVETAILRFAADSLPLGELHLVLGTRPDTLVTNGLVSFSSNWVVTNFDDMLNLLRYFPSSPALDSLRKAPPPERGRLWKEFWRSSDPNSATGNNEALDNYFRRVALANLRFRDEGVLGWRTDRGEVLIRLGEPDEVFDASPQSEGRLIRWGYTQYQLALYFLDETGFGRFRLTPSSRSELERVAALLSRRDQ
jgi:GWxTD domain-containing protein